MNGNYTSFKSEQQKNKTPWYLTPDIKPPKVFNPYEDGQSVFAEVFEENIREFGGSERCEYETDTDFQIRLHREADFTRRCADGKLKKAVTSTSFWLLITLFMMNSLSSVVAILNGYIPDGVYSMLYHVLLVVMYIGVFPVTFFIASVGNKTKSITFFKKPQASKFYVFRWVVIIFGVTHAVALAFNYLFMLLQRLGLHVNEIPMPESSGVTENILYFIAVAICAPIFEEILFRGFILTKLTRFGSLFAIISSGVLFGLFHQNHEQLFFATAFGILTGYVALRTKSIIPTVIAHVALNGYSYFISLAQSFAFKSEGALEAGTPDGPMIAVAITGIMSIAIYALIIIGIAMLITEIVANKAQFSLGKGDSMLSKSDKVRGFIANPSMILLLLILITNLITVSFVDLTAISSMLEGLYQ